MNKTILVALASVVLASCAVKKELVATGGSKADGTIELSYEYGPYEVPQINKAQGLEVAKKRCAAWGYKNAEEFGGFKTACNQFGGFGSCDRYIVTIQYQCLDK